MKKIFLKQAFLAGIILTFGFVVAGAVTYAQTSSGNGNASIKLEKDPGTGFFVLTVKASGGIKEFALYPPGKSPYGGGVTNCPTTFKNDTVFFSNPDDFTPTMSATVTDCSGVSTDFELSSSKEGIIVKPISSSATAQTSPSSAETSIAPKSQILTNIAFPIPELGNCQSEAECVAYCNDAANAKACIDFAKKNNLITAEEAVKDEKLATITNGPGGCNSQKSCEAYCSDISRLDECFSFAEKNNFLSADEMAKIENLKAAIKSGAKLPGGCNDQKSCEAYCNDTDHADECLSFGEQSGFLSRDEIQQYRKFTDLRKNGETPGHCSSKETCEAYCNSPDNAEECIAFAEKAGFLSGQDLEQAKKMLPLIKEGKTPGGCRTKQQCEAYCSDSAHSDECVTFGLQNGIISQQDAEVIKKTGGKGPGDCHGKEECQTYCMQHQQECMNWAKENGLEGQFSGPGGCKTQDECTSYCKDHPQECQQSAPPGSGSTGGFFQPTPENGGTDASIRVGNCKDLEECKAYCESHQEECQRLGVPDTALCVSGIPEYTKLEECQSYCHDHQDACDLSRYNYDVTRNSRHKANGTPATEYGGPGGCKSEEECKAYCIANPKDPGCNYQEGSSQSSPQNQSSTNEGSQPTATSSSTNSSSQQIPESYCSSFASIPSCSYAGSLDSDSYKYCKQCFPNK